MSETIAVFIDADNVSPKDMPLILQEIKGYGRIIISRVYTDWSKDSSKNWLKIITELGLEPIQCERITGKNSSDMRIAVDMMKVLYTQKNIGLYYLVTSDSDFRHLIPEIKLLNKQVNVIGKNLSKALENICDVSTRLEYLTDSQTRSTEANLQENIKNFYLEIENLLEANKFLELSKIKTLLQRKFNFDHREYGFNQISKFLTHYYSDKLKINKSNKGCYISSLN